MQQLEETLIILKKMWEEPGKVSYQGKHYSIVDAWCEPKPEPKIPIVVGGGGYTTMKHAAKYADIWNYPDSSAGTDTWSDKTILKRHLDDIGRDPATLRCSWFGRVAIGGPRPKPKRAVSPTREQVDARECLCGHVHSKSPSR